MTTNGLIASDQPVGLPREFRIPSIWDGISLGDFARAEIDHHDFSLTLICERGPPEPFTTATAPSLFRTRVSKVSSRHRR